MFWVTRSSTSITITVPSVCSWKRNSRISISMFWVRYCRSLSNFGKLATTRTKNSKPIVRNASGGTVRLLSVRCRRYIRALRQIMRRIRHPRAEPRPGNLRAGHSELERIFSLAPASLRAARASPPNYRRGALGGPQDAEALPRGVRSSQRRVRDVRSGTDSWREISGRLKQPGDFHDGYTGNAAGKIFHLVGQPFIA